MWVSGPLGAGCRELFVSGLRSERLCLRQVQFLGLGVFRRLGF